VKGFIRAENNLLKDGDGNIALLKGMAFGNNVWARRKILRDDESAGMPDIIFSTRSYDIGMMYNIGGFLNMFIELGDKKSGDFTSAYEKNEPAAIKQLDKLIETY